MALEPYDHLSDADFNRLASFIHGYSGIKMPLSKKSMVEGRLRRQGDHTTQVLHIAEVLTGKR